MVVDDVFHVAPAGEEIVVSAVVELQHAAVGKVFGISRSVVVYGEAEWKMLRGNGAHHFLRPLRVIAVRSTQYQLEVGTAARLGTCRRFAAITRIPRSVITIFCAVFVGC